MDAHRFCRPLLDSARMPTTDWNERWARDLKRFRKRRRLGKKDGHYGDHWGDPSLSGVRYQLYRLRPGNQSIGNLSKVVKNHLQPSFSVMNGPKMESMLTGRGFTVVEHDQSLLKHSNVVVFQRP